MSEQRHRPGEVRDAIIHFLGNRGTAASVQEIQVALANYIKDVAPSSVRSYLRLNSGTTFERVGRGKYALASASDDAFDQEVKRQSLPVFTYGKAKLFEGDCIEFLRQQPRESIHGVVTDPPYGLLEYSEKEQEKLRQGRGGVWRIPPSFDGHVRAPLPRFTVLNSNDLAQLGAFFESWARTLFPILVPGAHVIVASNPLLSYLVARAIVVSGFERRGEIVRLVMTMRGGDRPKNAHDEFSEVTVMPRSMWEPWLVFRKPVEGRVQDNLRKWKTGGLRRPSEQRPFGDVIKSHPTQKRERSIAPHPSLKPQAFLRQLVRAVLPLGEGIVLDPFAGSGSTLAAAENVGYASMGVEMDPQYIKLARRAIPQLAQLHAAHDQADTPSLFAAS